MIGIVDYDVGNIFSLAAALKRLGSSSKLVKREKDLAECEALILPGVGAYGDAMEHLKKYNLDHLLGEWVKEGKPLLGICLGMQLLFKESEEYGSHLGLGFLPGKIIKLPTGLKVPHMGWNKVIQNKNHYLFAGLKDIYGYFVHSYYAETGGEETLAYAQYGIKVPAVVGKDNIIGIQFHPEKSGKGGGKLLANWLEHLKNQ